MPRTTVVPPSKISSVTAATIWAPELDVPTSYPISPVPITGAVAQNIFISVNINNINMKPFDIDEWVIIDDY